MSPIRSEGMRKEVPASAREASYKSNAVLSIRESLKLEVVDTSKVVTSHVGFAKVYGFGVCFGYAVRYHHDITLVCNVLYMAKARVIAARWMSLLGVDRLGDIRRRE